MWFHVYEALPNPDGRRTVGARGWGVGVSWGDGSILEVHSGGWTPWEGARGRDEDGTFLVPFFFFDHN